MIVDVKSRASIDGEVKIQASLNGDICSKCIIGDAEIGKVIIKRYGIKAYDGAYFATPSVEPQVLDTANKWLSNDIEIRAIPYFDVSNEYGRTIYIGGNSNA